MSREERLRDEPKECLRRRLVPKRKCGFTLDALSGNGEGLVAYHFFAWVDLLGFQMT